MSKGGSNTSNTEVPAWLENAGIENINKARDVAQIGYTPYYGPEVAAFNPMQLQSMKTTGNAASAFGLAPQGFDATAGIPTPTDYAGGIQGYSSMPLYNESMAAFNAARPAQAAAINNMFIDPFTGAPATGNYGATETQQTQMIDRGDNSQVGAVAQEPIVASPVSTDQPMTENVQAVNDAIYPQASSNDLTNGDTFTGADGQMYTVGGGEGQVDAGLANAVIAAGAGTTTALPNSNITTNYSWDSTQGDGGASIDGYSLENGLPPASSTPYTPAVVPVSSSGVVDPIYSNSQAIGNGIEAGIQSLGNNGLISTVYQAATGNELIPATGSQGVGVSELSNADARPRTGLLSPQFDDLNVAKDNLMALIQGGGYDDVYDINGDGSLNAFDMFDLNDEARNRGVTLNQNTKPTEVEDTTPKPNTTTTFGTKGSKAEVNADGVVTYNQKFWANQLKAGVSQADLKLAQDALQDPNTPWNDAYSDVAINGTDWFKGIKSIFTAKEAAATLLEDKNDKAAKALVVKQAADKKAAVAKAAKIAADKKAYDLAQAKLKKKSTVNSGGEGLGAEQRNSNSGGYGGGGDSYDPSGRW